MDTRLLTQERVREVLEYSPKTGVFVWKVRLSSSAGPGNIAGCRNGQGYIIIKINNKLYGAHRLAFLYMDGYLPENDVDHLNGIRDDNLWENLRHVSKSCNLQNRKLQAGSISGFIGVSQYRRDKKWHARIYIHGKNVYLGGYETAEEAALARCHYENKSPDWTCNHLAVNRVKLRSMGYEI